MSKQVLIDYLENYGFAMIQADVLARRLIEEGFIKEEFTVEVER